MSFYVASLARAGVPAWAVVLLGWQPWAICRVAAFCTLWGGPVRAAPVARPPVPLRRAARGGASVRARGRGGHPGGLDPEGAARPRPGAPGCGRCSRADAAQDRAPGMAKRRARKTTRRTRRPGRHRRRCRRAGESGLRPRQCWWCSPAASGPALFRQGGSVRRDPGLSVLLVTVDTLRADALGAYGQAGARDALDRPAGPRRRALRPGPLPQRRHAALAREHPLGRYPFGHGIRDNSGFRFPAGTPTLASILKVARLPHRRVRERVPARLALRARTQGSRPTTTGWAGARSAPRSWCPSARAR